MDHHSKRASRWSRHFDKLHQVTRLPAILKKLIVSSRSMFLTYAFVWNVSSFLFLSLSLNRLKKTKSNWNADEWCQRFVVLRRPMIIQCWVPWWCPNRWSTVPFLTRIPCRSSWFGNSMLRQLVILISPISGHWYRIVSLIFNRNESIRQIFTVVVYALCMIMWNITNTVWLSSGMNINKSSAPSVQVNWPIVRKHGHGLEQVNHFSSLWNQNDKCSNGSAIKRQRKAVPKPTKITSSMPTTNAYKWVVVLNRWISVYRFNRTWTKVAHDRATRMLVNLYRAANIFKSWKSKSSDLLVEERSFSRSLSFRSMLNETEGGRSISEWWCWCSILYRLESKRKMRELESITRLSRFVLFCEFLWFFPLFSLRFFLLWTTWIILEDDSSTMWNTECSKVFVHDIKENETERA